VRPTIFALATAPGRAAVAIIRLSGPGALAALITMTGGGARPGGARRRRVRKKNSDRGATAQAHSRR